MAFAMHSSSSAAIIGSCPTHRQCRAVALLWVRRERNGRPPEQEPRVTDRSYDVAVVGGGAAGLSAALAFARDGFRTALVGSLSARRDGRTVALLGGSVRFLEALGVWPALVGQAAPLETMQIIDDTGSLFRPPPATFRSGGIGLDAFGWNIESAALVEGLAAAAISAERLDVIEGQAAGLRVAKSEAVLDVADAGTLGAALVVAADGRNSTLRERAGMATRTWSYPQVALTTILAHDRDHRETSTEFHTRQGPFTLVPLPGRRSSLVWVTSPERARSLAELPNEALAL